MKRNEAAPMSLSGQSTSGEGQKSSDSNARDAPREVPSLDHWLKLAQEELETGQSLNIDGIHTAVCIDISDSMKLGDAWKQSKEFFTQFIQAHINGRLNTSSCNLIISPLAPITGLSENQKIDDDEYVALSVFGRDVRVVQRLTKKYNHLQQAFDSLKIGGPSPLYGGLLMALAGVTSVTVGIVNGVKITSRIILVTDGHPTNPLLITGSDDYDPDKKRKNQVTAIQAADIIASKRVRIDCVPVGDADVPFLDVIASRTQGKVYSYTDGKMLGRRTTTYCCAGHILSMWRMMSLFGSSVDTDTLLEVMIDLHAPDQITSLSQDEQEEVLEIAKDAFKTDEFLDVIRELEVNYEFDDPDVKLPDLGTRVRLVRDSNNSQRDECGPGTIVGHHRNKTQVRVEWDSNKKAELYYFGEKENNEVEIVNEPRILQPNQLIATGCHVKRGKDWKWGDQDGTPGTIGVVVKVQDDGLVWVRWPDKRKNMYRFGAKGRFDLEICPPVSRTANSATTPRQSSPPQPGPKSEDESFSDPLSSKSSQKGKDKIEEIYTRTAVKTSTQQSPTQRGLTSTTSTNMIPTTTTDTSIPATTTIMMTSSTTHVVTRNTTTTDSTSSLTTVMAASSETLTPSVLNMPSSIATNTIQNTTFLENEGASRSGNSLLSSSEPVSTSTQTTATTSRDSSSDSTQTATNTGNLGLSESVSRVSNTYWDELAKRELVEAQMINTPGIHTVICVDTSESMRQGSAWKETQQFFDEFIEEMEMITKETDIKDEQIALSVFGQEVKVVQRLCKNYRQLREAFRILKIGGPTPMCGGLKMALAGFANPGKTGILNRELEGLRMALAGITCISIPVINGIIIPPRIIIITDGHPTDTLLSSGPDVRVSTEEAKSDVIKAVRKISKRKISIHIVPVGDADESFLSLIASKADGQIVTYTEGRKLARRAINNLYAGIVLQQWKKDNEIGRLFDTEMSLEDVMDVPVDSRIASLSEENKVEVLHTDKQAIEKGLLDNDVEDELEKYHYESDGKKVDLPPLGTRVRRATNSDRQIQDDDGLGTIVGQHKIKKQVRVEWDRNGKSDFCRYGDEEKYDVIIVNEHRILQSNEQIAVGCHVKRGKDWRWGNQGGKPDAVGVVIRVKDDKWVSVRWPDKSKNVYRFGADGCFDLQLCDPSGNAIEGQTTRGITKSEQISTLQLCLENPASLLPQLLSMVKKHSDMTQKESLASYNPDIKLSPVGTQARRGSDSASGQQDENSPESIIVHHKDKICNPDESQTADGTTTSAQTSTPLKQSVPSSFIMSNLQSLMKKIVKIDRNAGRRFKELDDPDVKLPSLGTRVRRGPDWDRGQQDDDGPGTIISHHKNKRQVLVEWDNNGTCDFYRFDEKDKQDVMVVNEPRVLQANERIATGCRVKRGKDWKWDYQDGTPGAEGVVIQVQDDDMVWVRWPHKKRNIYRYGREGCFDLEVCNPDEKYTVGLQTQPGHLLNVQMHESSRTPSKVPTAGNISDMEKNGSTSTVSLMNTSTMQPPTFINTMMASNDTSSLPTETITTTGCTITAKTPVHETQISTFATTLSVTSNTITGLPVRFDRTKNIHYKPGSELGRGCYGNIIYKGRFDERDVAVNRLLKENFSFAEQEIELLRQSDQRPNVIRYYWNEHDDHFLYIALELCEETLQGYVEDKLSKIKKLKPIDLLHQIMKGLEYLHSLGIVHRDLKPHNILISRPSAQGEVRALISDFGLSRMLPPGKQSFSSKSDVYGAEGWAAPEMSITSQNKHESSRTPSKVPTAGNISDMEKNGSTSTVSIMNTSTMQQPTFINETMGSYDTSSSPTEAITTTDCTIAAKTPAQQTQISTIATTSSVTSNTITGLPVRLDRTKNIYYKPESELGRGCYGTIVYKGNFDERDVAVKRLLKENFSFAEREIELLRQSDQHPNVIRYYWNEHDDHFLYIALELCEGTLQDYVEDKLSKIKKLEPIELLRQTMNGLTYLHSLGIVHRDLKPHNILISRPSAQGEVRALISDFGLSKKLPPGKQSFSSKSDVYGTEGWAAPEMSITSQNKTLAVDIFSAGCVMHYTLTRGKHPFGDKPFQIQSRIQKGKFKLDELPTTSDGYIAKDIIRDMLSSIPEARPTANDVLQHLLFWNKDVKLRFIEDTSDWMLTNMFPILETHPDKMFELDWTKPLSQELKDDLRYDTRGYDTSSVTDLLRLIRNKRHHYNQLPEDVQKSLGSVPDEYLDYFTSRFPLLLIHTYQVMKCCSKEDAFKAYYKHT